MPAAATMQSYDPKTITVLKKIAFLLILHDQFWRHQWICAENRFVQQVYRRRRSIDRFFVFSTQKHWEIFAQKDIRFVRRRWETTRNSWKCRFFQKPQGHRQPNFAILLLHFGPQFLLIWEQFSPNLSVEKSLSKNKLLQQQKTYRLVKNFAQSFTLFVERQSFCAFRAWRLKQR